MASIGGPGVEGRSPRLLGRLGTGLLLGFFLAPGCAPPDSDRGPVDRTSGPTAQPSVEFQGNTYRRELAFTSLREDTTTLVAWSFTATTGSVSVQRRTRGWLARAGTWDAFTDLSWETPGSRAPWRILPRGPVRLLMGDGEALEAVAFREGARELELVPGGVMAEWAGGGGEVYRVEVGSVRLGGQDADGVLLDMVRAWRTRDTVATDWAFVTSGDSVQIVMVEVPGSREGASTSLEAWARLDFRDLRWPRVTLEQAEVRAFERARRDVPFAWSLASSDGEVTGELSVQAAHLEAGEGPGPLLPVLALFEFAGTVQIEGSSYSVRGLLRHHQP